VARGKRLGSLVVLACTVLAVVALGACSPPPAAPVPRPKVFPPVVREAGVLRAGVDLSYPPFAGVDGARDAGIDIDIASALAGRLGLRIQFVDVKASQIATALASGDVDIVMSAPFSAEVLSRGTIAGTYLADGPVLFALKGSDVPRATVTLDDLDGAKVGAQQGSEAYWRLADEFGARNVTAYTSLREAFAGLGRGDVTYVGGDALVGAYIARDQPDTRYVGTIAPAHLLGVAVAADNKKLADAVRKTLDSLAAGGALDTIRASWVGSLPKLSLTSSDATTTSAESTMTP
jgi:ABC-type amino acid transport substrate-binding protein